MMPASGAAAGTPSDDRIASRLVVVCSCDQSTAL
jgi:hypothetical protein